MKRVSKGVGATPLKQFIKFKVYKVYKVIKWKVYKVCKERLVMESGVITNCLPQGR